MSKLKRSFVQFVIKLTKSNNFTKPTIFINLNKFTKLTLRLKKYLEKDSNPKYSPTIPLAPTYFIPYHIQQTKILKFHIPNPNLFFPILSRNSTEATYTKKTILNLKMIEIVKQITSQQYQKSTDRSYLLTQTNAWGSPTINLSIFYFSIENLILTNWYSIPFFVVRSEDVTFDRRFCWFELDNRTIEMGWE